MIQTMIAIGVLIYLLFIVGEFLNGKINIIHGVMFLLIVSLSFRQSIEKTMLIIMSIILLALFIIKIKIAKSKLNV